MQDTLRSDLPRTTKIYQPSPFRLVLNKIQDEQQVSLLGMFFSGGRTEIPLLELCSTDLVRHLTTAKQDTFKYENVQHKIAEAIKTATDRGDIKEADKQIKRRRRHGDPLYRILSEATAKYLILFNKVHTLLKIIYAFENAIEVSEISKIKLSMIELLKKTHVLTKREQHTLHELNGIRNLLSHQEVTIQLSSLDFEPLISNIQDVNAITLRLLNYNKEEIYRVRDENMKLIMHHYVIKNQEYKATLAS